MNYKLNEHNGIVRYLTRQNGAVVERKTKIESATWMLDQCKPEKSNEFEGYPIAVKMNGNEYFFSGEWLMGGAEDVLTNESKEPEQSKAAAPKKRRTKDVVCE